MAFQNVRRIMQAGPPVSSFKLLMAAAMSTRPRYRWMFRSLLQPFVHHGEITVQYRCYECVYSILLRMSDLAADWMSTKELGVVDVYQLERGFKAELVIDGGGNIGLFTLRVAAALGLTGKDEIVICEPLPRNIEQIHKHLAMNRIEAEVRSSCLGGTRRSILFYCRDANQSSFDSREAYETVIEVPVILLDDAIGESVAERILIKLDIEGMEIEALGAFVRPSERRAIYIVGELHDRPTNVPLLEQIFRVNGWTLELFDVDVKTASFRACSPTAVPLLRWATALTGVDSLPCVVDN